MLNSTACFINQRVQLQREVIKAKFEYKFYRPQSHDKLEIGFYERLSQKCTV